MTAGQTNILVVGRASSTKNAGYIGWNYSGTDGSDNNYLSMGHWGNNNLVRLYGDGNFQIMDGNVTVSGGFFSSSADSTPFSTAFANALAAADATGRVVYFDAAGASGVSTWYGSGNTAWAAIDVASNSMNFWINVSGGWNNMVDISTNGLVCSSNITAYGSTSDIRLKTEIEIIPDAMSKIRKLDGITFRYKKDGSKSTGLIAQQLLEVLPEVVYETEDIDREYGEEPNGEKHYAVRYGNVVGLLVEGLKEQDKEINELKEMVQTLMEKLNGNN
jgi:hypothetical protein